MTNSYKDDSGYVKLYMPEHPNNNKGYIFEHRYVVEQAIGRLLETHETVHHINEIKDDNRLGNLYLCSPEEHIAIHTRGIKRTSEQNKKNRQAHRNKRINQRATGT